MSAEKTTPSAVKQCQKVVWKQIKNSSLLSYFQKTKKSITDVSENVADVNETMLTVEASAEMSTTTATGLTRDAPHAEEQPQLSDKERLNERSDKKSVCQKKPDPMACNSGSIESSDPSPKSSLNRRVVPSSRPRQQNVCNNTESPNVKKFGENSNSRDARQTRTAKSNVVTSRSQQKNVTIKNPKVEKFRNNYYNRDARQTGTSKSYAVISRLRQQRDRNAIENPNAEKFRNNYNNRDARQTGTSKSYAVISRLHQQRVRNVNENPNVEKFRNNYNNRDTRRTRTNASAPRPQQQNVYNTTKGPKSREIDGNCNSHDACQTETPRVKIRINEEYKNVVKMYLSSNKDVVLNRTENACGPVIAAKETEAKSPTATSVGDEAKCLEFNATEVYEDCSRPAMTSSPSSSPEDMKQSTTLVTTADSVKNAVPPKSDNSGPTNRTANSVMTDEDEIDQIYTLCNRMIKGYEKRHNLDVVIYSLVEDKTSIVRTRHHEFVTTTIEITFDRESNSRTEVGNMFAELLSREVLTVTEITRGISTIFRDWTEYLAEYPDFFSYVADIVAPLLISKTSPFDFLNLKNACAAIRPSNSSTFFVNVLQTILRSEDTHNVQNSNAIDDYGAALRTYNVWRKESKYVPLDMFIPDRKINAIFKNDQLGVLLLAMTMFKISKTINENVSLYTRTQKWIRKNINKKTVEMPYFVRSLTIATAMVCSDNDENVKFFDRDRGILIQNYVQSEFAFTTAEILLREAQCIHGCRAIAAAIGEKRKSKELKSTLLRELFRVHAISTDSINADEGCSNVVFE